MDYTQVDKGPNQPPSYLLTAKSALWYDVNHTEEINPDVTIPMAWALTVSNSIHAGEVTLSDATKARDAAMPRVKQDAGRLQNSNSTLPIPEPRSGVCSMIDDLGIVSR